ncbi:MoaA/NifB/PqqE/SkfB family radical SAM enzyme [Sporomusaceae bacterium BoRhaA]|uniref:radical SAM/SPASM domain-containing protein n=1 Tax=Pelorhabdus rhamnosifermentans TaxID=2772457 RepID=UPI001C05ED95|nr:radical SAM protein [Pelorhabdus rhamnosifermentans]MBU2703217.1 MoaA/NifB/PqqE/SkfB family radical SAM enzyme [Pelorhabdus rhamnosifermentans]
MQNSNVNRKKIEQERREKLRIEKPLVYEKVLKINDKYLNGESVAMLDISYDYICNFKCEHCCNNSFQVKDRSLTIDDLRNISEQADQLGLFQFTLTGGEPLLFKDLDNIIQALNPEKFHISVNTNGYLLTYNMAKHLKEIGVDKVKISIDSFRKDKHNQIRHNSQAYTHAFEALFNAQKAGLHVVAQHVATRQNTQTQDTVELAKFAQKNDFALDVLIAKALGQWEGNHDVLINEEDAAFLRELHKEYPVVWRDVFPAYGLEKGCISVNSILGITKYGDVLPCPFIHIGIGNIFEESLKDIIDRGLRIKHFKEFRTKCLSGEDRCFIDTYMTKFYGKPLPIHWSEAFSDEDFIDGIAK